MAQTADCPRYIWIHNLFSNLPLQTRVYTSSASTDEVDNIRLSSGNWNYYRLLAITFLIPSNFILNSFSGIIVKVIIWPAALLLIPLSIGFSILRYRLYDIDLLINRTLVYGTLTVLLALVYFGLIFALQYLLRGIINQNNDVAIVISTLAIAGLE